MKRFWLHYAALVFVTIAMQPTLSGAASSSSTVIAAQVSSATNLDTTLCATGQSGRTDLGSMQPGTDGIGVTGCQIGFGSSNDTGRLVMTQRDGAGSAMYRSFDGSVDTTFATAGYQTTSVTAGDDMYVDAAPIPTGGYYVLGTSDNANDDVFVEKRDANWALVAGFGTAGRATINYAANDAATKVSVDSSGRAVVFATAGTTALVHRLTTLGVLDTTFSGDGTADVGLTTLSPPNGTPLDDGRIALAVSDDNGPNQDVQLAMLRANGTLDTSSGGGDGIGNYYDSGDGHDKVSDVEPAPNGDVYVAITTQRNGSDAEVLRFNGDATLDTGFGVAGSTNPTFNACCAHSAVDLEVAEDGKLVLLGYVNGGTNDLWVARFTVAGALDPSFAGGILEEVPGLWHQDDQLLLADDGTIVVALGQRWDPYDSTEDGGWVVRISSSGAIETSLNANAGHALVHPSAATNSSLAAVVQGADGSVYTVGYANYASDLRTLTSRLGSVPIPQYDTGTDRDFDSVANQSFGACLVSVTSASATAPWSAQGAGCSAAGVANWQPVADTTAAATAQVAAATNTTGATALIRFGLHTQLNTKPGRYVAPIRFSVVAP